MLYCDAVFMFQSVQLEAMLKNEAPKLTIAQFQYEVSLLSFYTLCN